MVLKKNLLIILLASALSACKHDKPLALIKNLPVMSEQEQVFSVKEDTRVHIYGTGEASIDLVTVDPIYLYKPDAVQLYVKQKHGKLLAFDFPLQDSLGSHSSEVAYTANNANFNAMYDKHKRFYKVKIALPFTLINPNGNPPEKVLMNVTVADDDDYLKQKAKLAWLGNKDPLLTPQVPFGEVLLKTERADTGYHSAQSMISYAAPVDIIHLEQNLPVVNIDRLIFGQINKAEDFSATMSSSWKTDSLFLYFTIHDNKEGRIDPKSIKTLSRFHDWGWIEDEKGNAVWKMTNFYSKYAGGALKNRKIDTTILLKTGTYRLKYVTDESHSWNKWDDEPPDVPFYGIKVSVKNSVD